jgi:uncharacterized protein (TIGR00369 family)
MIDIAGLTLARAAMGETGGGLHSASVNVSYLAAAIQQTLIAEAVMLRRGKELCFVDVTISTDSGKLVAKGVSTVRARGASAPDVVRAKGDEGLADPGVMGPNLPKRVAFIGHLGMQVENMSAAQSRIVMPFKAANADADGNLHEGPILALLDTTGAMAAWALTGPGSYKASTVGLQAGFRAPAPPEDLVAYGRVCQRDGEIFWCEVEVAVRTTQNLVAAGTVLYRIVTS